MNTIEREPSLLNGPIQDNNTGSAPSELDKLLQSIMENQYNDGKRAFLQSLMSRGVLTLAEGKRILAAILTVQKEKQIEADEVSQETLDSYIASAADAVSCFEYEIRCTQHQITKDKIYAFVNSVSDSLTQMATTKSPDELLYIRRLLDAIFETYNSRRREVMAIKSMQALETKIRKGNSEKGLTQSEAEKLLATLEKEKWLERSSEGFYSLAPRALMELRSWLVDTYNDNEDHQAWQKIKFCKACKEIVTVGQRCSDLDCNIRLHNICEAAYWKSRPSRNCPKCKIEWKGNKFVGEKAITHGEENLRQKSTGVKRNRSTLLEDNEECSQIHKNWNELDSSRSGTRRKIHHSELQSADEASADGDAESDEE